jgi:arsenite-transporting ATPase
VTSAVLVTGAGGVGKTTVAAALAVSAASSGAHALVVTVDPARRLAQALGVAGLGNDPRPVPNAPGLDAAMLDVAASWEAIVAQHAPPEVATRLMDNPFFRAIADRFPAAQAYAAGEQLAEFLEQQAWDVIVVDTPPAGGGIDFFLAPYRMQEFVGGRLLRWLTGARLPGRRTLFRVTGRPVLRFADAVLGGPLLEEVADFLFDLRTMHDGLARRAAAIERHLRAASTIVVTSADPAPRREARRFFRELPAAAGPPAAVLFNRTLPDSWINPAARRVPADDRRTAILDGNLVRWSEEARRQADARAEFSVAYGVPLATLPWLPEAPTDLTALAGLIVGATDLPFDVLGLPPPPG